MAGGKRYSLLSSFASVRAFQQNKQSAEEAGVKSVSSLTVERCALESALYLEPEYMKWNYGCESCN
jgi:hypothetical protein